MIRGAMGGHEVEMAAGAQPAGERGDEEKRRRSTFSRCGGRLGEQGEHGATGLQLAGKGATRGARELNRLQGHRWQVRGQEAQRAAVRLEGGQKGQMAQKAVRQQQVAGSSTQGAASSQGPATSASLCSPRPYPPLALHQQSLPAAASTATRTCLAASALPSLSASAVAHTSLAATTPLSLSASAVAYTSLAAATPLLIPADATQAIAAPAAASAAALASSLVRVQQPVRHLLSKELQLYFDKV